MLSALRSYLLHSIQVIFNCIDISHFVYLSINCRVLGGFQLEVPMTNAVVNVHAQVFVWTYVFNSPGIYP